MKKVITLLILSLFAASAFAELKPCPELKSEIAAKLDAKGVKDYQLDVVATEDVKDKTVVGSCEGGTKKITYQKTAGEPTPPKTPAPSHK